MEAENERSLDLEVYVIRFLPGEPPMPVADRQPSRLPDPEAAYLPSLTNKQ